MVLGDLIVEVRKLIDDQVSEYRWSDEVICGYLRDSIVWLNKGRPDSRYLNGRLVDKIDWPTSLANFVIPEEYAQWTQGFAYFAAARCLEQDSSDTVNSQRSADYLAKAERWFSL